MCAFRQHTHQLPSVLLQAAAHCSWVLFHLDWLVHMAACAKFSKAIFGCVKTSNSSTGKTLQCFHFAWNWFSEEYYRETKSKLIFYHLHQEEPMSICWSVGWSAGLHNDWSTDFHQTWMENVHFLVRIRTGWDHLNLGYQSQTLQGSFIHFF